MDGPSSSPEPFPALLMGRLFVIVVLALTGFWAVSASSGGAGARTITTSQTPARALAAYDAKLERDRLAAEAAERRRRYPTARGGKWYGTGRGDPGPRCNT